MLWKFLDDNGTFVANNPHKISRLYFPLANEKGLLSSITPTLHGDIKLDQDTFLTVPLCTEDLKNSYYNRNLWVYVENKGVWSAASGDVDESIVEAGMLWHKLIRVNKAIGLKAEFINFVPVSNDTVEIMTVKLTNITKAPLKITPTSAIPLYGRSADRLRDHRHVTSLLNRLEIKRCGIILKPTMVFNERNHTINKTSYFIFGCDSSGKPPAGFFPTMPLFTGEEGNLSEPDAVFRNLIPFKRIEPSMQGKETIGALRFKTENILPGRSITYIFVLGIEPDDKKSPERIFLKYNSCNKVARCLIQNKKFWLKKISAVQVKSENKDFDRWLRWVTLQPVLRKLFGCSYLPDFDYGRGGRGWRDLWQDLLTLLIVNPSEASQLLVNNFYGVRTDGTNATIIGKKTKEFIPDRNNIQRVWMDHGVWPFITLNLYINQTGDTDILFRRAGYFESKKMDSILEHILCQHLRPFKNVGRHGYFRLEGGDWNDGLDMAKENGESVTFTAMYAGNMLELASLLEKINYTKTVINDLRKKAFSLIQRIRNEEWIKVSTGHGFFNGYYDNKGTRVEGDHPKGVRMTLTGQVFPIMSGVATDLQIKEIYRSAKRYLWDADLKGFRLNTDFKEVYPELGRAFGFVYGEKENGAFFSHMNVMFAFALYKRNFVKEGFEVLNSIYNMCKNTYLSKIYPGLPEYFNSEGRGMYHYLTGSATWLVLTIITQVFGIRGVLGELLIEPKLVKEQFGKKKNISIDTYFVGRKIKLTYYNPDGLDYGVYKIVDIKINKKSAPEKMPLPRKTFLEMTKASKENLIDVYLGR